MKQAYFCEAHLKGFLSLFLAGETFFMWLSQFLHVYFVRARVLRPEILSFSGSLKLRFSFTRKTQKGRPLGQKFSQGTTKLNLRDKNNIVPSLGTPKFVCFLSKKRKKLSSKKNLQKKLALAEKSL